MSNNAESFDRWIRTSFVEMNTALENRYFSQEDRARVIGFPHAGPARRRLRSAPPIGSGWRRSIGNAEERRNAAVSNARERALRDASGRSCGLYRTGDKRQNSSNQRPIFHGK